MSEEDIDQLCAELIEWAHKETSIAVRDFYTDLYITRDRWQDWMHKFPKLKETNAWAKLKIASRHEARMLDRRYDANSARLALRMLDPDWQAQHVEDMERRARLSNDNGPKSITIAGIDFVASDTKFGLPEVTD